MENNDTLKAMSEIAKLKMNEEFMGAYTDRYNAGHAEAVKQMQELHERAYASPTINAKAAHPLSAVSSTQEVIERSRAKSMNTELILVVVLIVGTLFMLSFPDNGCYIDWDGFSNPTVCE